MCRKLDTVTLELFLALFKMYARPYLEVHRVVEPLLFQKNIILLDQMQISNQVCDMSKT